MLIKNRIYSNKKLKKARFKRKVARALKRGEPLYGGFITFTDDIKGWDLKIHVKQ